MMRRLLRNLLPEGDAAPLLGDLDEESLQVAKKHGRAAARRWFVRQCLLSVPPLLMARLRRLSARDWQIAVAAVLCFVLAPILSIELLRSFALSQVPLKEDALLWLATIPCLSAGVCAGAKLRLAFEGD